MKGKKEGKGGKREEKIEEVKKEKRKRVSSFGCMMGV